MPRSTAERSLSVAIDVAFADVVLGSGVSLRETVAIDMYAGTAERARVRGADEQTHWRRVVFDPDLGRLGHVGGPVFLDAEGMRFYLPVYLVLALQDFDSPQAEPALDSLMRLLSDPSDERFSLLDQAQRWCVGRVLDHLRVAHELEDAGLDRAIERWLAS